MPLALATEKIEEFCVEARSAIHKDVIISSPWMRAMGYFLNARILNFELERSDLTANSKQF